ncbi:Carboxylic ester hydrolase [Mycena venus]|uniref:Carboxylic ester hydrolase n=1 Tax=Mycena venus TaxID=2733690 RepID=A0A8H6YVM8_9AGAR|nr:Carboxylic ester hydrolase [Mycena venus]
MRLSILQLEQYRPSLNRYKIRWVQLLGALPSGTHVTLPQLSAQLTSGCQVDTIRIAITTSEIRVRPGHIYNVCPGDYTVMMNPLLTTALLLPIFGRAAEDPAARCLALKNTLQLENTTILDVAYVAAPTNVSATGSCQLYAPVTAAPLCRVYFVINSTATSAVHAEAWLPDTWYGRFLGLGNGGLNGCIDYVGLDYGTSLHFAAVSSDNGHDGNSGLPFLNHPEVINDFAYRAIHLEAVIGKQIVAAYYSASQIKSYYLGCSTGGRQGTQAALKFPEDFDGILAGAPATDFNSLTGWIGMLGHYVGETGPDSNTTVDTSPKFITPELWSVVSAEILRQCDALDGVKDGIITEPDECNFRPEAIQCTANQTTGCLTPVQVEAVKNIYSPLFGLDGQLIYPRYSPGAEADPLASLIFGGNIWSPVADWERYAVLNVTEHDFTNFSLQDVELLRQVNPGGIATFDGNLSAFRDRGGKFLTYHGRRDPLISSTNSKRVYDLISRTLSLPLLDDFYRLFLIPGMGHCFGGLGPTSFGQGRAPGTNPVNDSAHNILLALVDWVEDGVAPATIIGSDGNGTERTHCRYPMRSVFNGTVFVCEK